jgi:hypothetical protein
VEKLLFWSDKAVNFFLWSPIVSIAALLGRFEKKSFAAGIVVLAAFGCYVFLIRQELAMIAGSFATQISTCFGVRVIPNLLLHHELLSEAGRRK